MSSAWFMQRSRGTKVPPPSIRGSRSLDDAHAVAGRRSNSEQLHIRRKKKRQSGGTEGASASSSAQIQTSSDEAAAAGHGGMEPNFARFGPVYGEDIQANQTLKVVAWDHVLQGDEESSYLRSIAQVELKARESYDPHKLKLPALQFQKMMATDGCLFLQLALHILGAGRLLNYPEMHPYFGTSKDTTHWIPAMFSVGNQIPYVVIRELMDRKFFKSVIQEGIEKGTWLQPPKELPKLILYLTVVEPQLKRPAPISLLLNKFMLRQTPPRLWEPPSDILRNLHSLLLGPGTNPAYSEIKKFRDLEAGGDDDQDIKFPSAGELIKSGIMLQVANKGITSIRFQDLIFRAYLYVPPLTIDAYTEGMLDSLARYEQNLDEADRELTAYLRFIRDLARTYKDFKILKEARIIQVEEGFENTTLQMLNKLITSHKCNYTLNFRHIENKITDYKKPPWRLISFFLSVLTIVQTVFTILGYFWPPN